MKINKVSEEWHAASPCQSEARDERTLHERVKYADAILDAKVSRNALFGGLHLLSCIEFLSCKIIKWTTQYSLKSTFYVSFIVWMLHSLVSRLSGRGEGKEKAQSLLQ